MNVNCLIMIRFVPILALEKHAFYIITSKNKDIFALSQIETDFSFQNNKHTSKSPKQRFIGRFLVWHGS